MKRCLIALLTTVCLVISTGTGAQTPPPTPPTDKKADPKKPEKAEQEPRPVEQELQKQESQKKDAPAPVQPTPAPVPAGAVAPATEPEKKDEKKKWDVNNPPGPSYDVEIDVTEGTWMSLDVSSRRAGNRLRPPGRPLHDAHRRRRGQGASPPASPGTCSRATRPNGKWIAFTSDRSGGDNLWYMNRDGSDPKQVTKETFRLLNQPAWSPDSEYLVGRKHFTSERSLGAGEMWIYHRIGRRRTAAHQEAHRPEGQRRAGVLPRRPLRLLQRRHHARGDLRVQQGSERRRSTHPARRPRDAATSTATSPARAARSSRRRRRTASRSPSSGASATKRRSS